MSVSQAEIKAVLTLQDNLSKQMATAGTSVNAFGQHVNKTGAQVNAQFTAMGKAAGEVAKAVAVAGAAVGGALVAGLGASVSAAANFEKTMSAVGAVSGATAGEMQQLSALALQLGKDTSFSASAAAGGIEELIKGGLTIADVMGGGAKAALDLAAAGSVDLATAAEIASNAVGQFALKGSDLGHVADLIAGAANASSLSVTDFKFSLAAVGAVAKAAGFSFDDTAVAIAELGKAGIKGSDAGTSLKAFIAGLTPSTKKAAQEMGKLGLLTDEAGNSFFDAAGNVKSMAEVQRLLAEATKTLTNEERLMAFEVMFGSDAIRAASVLAGEGAEGFEEMAASMSKVTAAGVGAAKLDNLSGDIEQLKGSAETAAIMLGMKLTPVLRSLGQAATQGLNAAMPMIEAFGQNVADAIGTIQAVFGAGWSPDESINPLVNSIGQLAIVVRDQAIPAVQEMAVELGMLFGFLQEHHQTIATVAVAFAAFSVLTSVAGTVAAVATAFAALAPAIVAAGGALPFIVALMGGPVTLAIGAVVLAVGALALAWQTNFMDIQGHTAAFVAFVTPLVQAVITEVGRFATEMLPYATAAWTAISGIVIAKATEIWTGVQTVVAALTAFWTENHATIQAVATRVWSAIEGLITFAWGNVQSTIKAGLQLLSGDWSGAWETMRANLQKNWDQIRGAVGPAWAAVSAAIMAAITSLIGAVSAKAAEIGQAITAGIISGAAGLRDRLGSALSSAVAGSLEQAKAALGIRSPSALAADQVGAPIAEGIIQGFIERMGAGGEMAEAIRAVVTTALKYGIDPAIALALAKAESGLVPTKRNTNGEDSVGLFQMNRSGGQGTGHSVEELQDPWRNAELFLSQHGDLFRQLAQTLSGADLARVFGGKAEVSDPQFHGRYAEAYNEIGATPMGAAPAQQAAPPAMADPTAWLKERADAFNTLFEEMQTAPAGGAAEALERMAAAMPELQSKVAEGTISFESMAATITALGRNAGLGTEAFDKFSAGQMDSVSAMEQTIRDAAKADAAFQPFVDKMGEAGSSMRDIGLGFINALAEWKKAQPPSTAETGAIPGAEGLATLQAQAVQVAQAIIAEAQVANAMIEQFTANAAEVANATFEQSAFSAAAFANAALTNADLQANGANFTDPRFSSIGSIDSIGTVGSMTVESLNLPESTSSSSSSEPEETTTTTSRAAASGATHITNNNFNLTTHPRPGDEVRVRESFETMAALYGSL